MARGESGKIYVGTRGLGRVYEITDNGKERTSRVVVAKLIQPAVTMHKGSLYVMAIDKVLRYDDIENNPNVQPVDLTAKFNLPPEQHHNWKYIRFGPDPTTSSTFPSARLATSACQAMPIRSCVATTLMAPTWKWLHAAYATR